MNKKIIWGIVGFVVLVVVLVGLKKAGVIGKDEGTEVTVEKVELRTITESVNASGKVYPEIEVKVRDYEASEFIANLHKYLDSKITKEQQMFTTYIKYLIAITIKNIYVFILYIYPSNLPYLSNLSHNIFIT